MQIYARHRLLGETTALAILMTEVEAEYHLSSRRQPRKFTGSMISPGSVAPLHGHETSD